MSYTTEFEGRIELNKPLDEELFNFLMKLNQTRRMKRDPQKLKEMGYPDDYGIDGEFFVDGGGLFGQEIDDSVMNGDIPPQTQPSLWCRWRPTTDRSGIEWDGGEKFYCADDWMRYLIDSILAPAGYLANGEIQATGEEVWQLIVTDNEVNTIYG